MREEAYLAREAARLRAFRARHKEKHAGAIMLKRGLEVFAEVAAVTRAGVFVRVCLAYGCPASLIERGAGVDVRALVGRGRRRPAVDAPVGLDAHELGRLMAWCDWVQASSAYAMGVGTQAEAVQAASIARLAGCDVDAWMPEKRA